MLVNFAFCCGIQRKTSGEIFMVTAKRGLGQWFVTAARRLCCNILISNSPLAQNLGGLSRTHDRSCIFLRMVGTTNRRTDKRESREKGFSAQITPNKRNNTNTSHKVTTEYMPILPLPLPLQKQPSPCLLFVHHHGNVITAR